MSSFTIPHISVGLVTDSHHVCKFGLEGGAADQKTVQRTDLEVVACVLAVCATAVENADLVGVVDVFVEPSTQPGEDFLGLFGR